MKEKNLKSKMTIDKLAIMVAKGFESVESRMATKDDIKNMATKLDIEDLKNKIEGINNRLDSHALNKVSYDKFDPLVKRVEKLEKTR
jgi:hypothetical protein